MTKLSRLQNKKSKIVVGLISGTSVDGIDAALVRITGSGTSTRVQQIALATYSYPKKLRELILANSLPGTGSVDLLCELNVLCAHFFADAVKKIARKAGMPLSRIDLIGSHGQTVHHLPVPKKMFGKSVRSTLQLADPSTIAKLTGIPTVGDFRMGDMAVGGEGAPMVPYFDYLMFRSAKFNRILLNLGGIANFTVLPKNCSTRDVVAFDTGPANIVIDALMQKFYNKKFDQGGLFGLKGTILPELLVWMMRHPYFKQQPPKSTGRELFGKQYVAELLKRAKRFRREDILATVTELTAFSVFDQYNRFIAKTMRVDEVLVSGGGAHNRAIMEALQDYFRTARVRTLENVGFSSDAKEAICFAVLANETIAEHPANIPSVTGAMKSVVLGKICL